MHRSLRMQSTLLALCISIWFCWVSRDYIFFWDTIQLASRHAHWYFENQFSKFFLPEEIDSGNPPFFGIYLAFLWNLIGKSLLISHFAMLPFLFICFYMSFRLGYDHAGIWGFWLFPSMLFLHACFAGQAVLVSPDIALAACFMTAVWASISHKPKFLALAGIGLGLISLRGFIVLGCLIIWEFWNLGFKKTSVSRRKLKYYLPGIIIIGLYQVLHFAHNGWVIVHEQSPWAQSFKLIEFDTIWRNLGVFIWRILDYGHVFIVLGLAVLGIEGKVQKKNKLFRLCMVILVVFGLVLIPFKGLLAHRYLLPFYILSSLLLVSVLDMRMKHNRYRFAFLVVILSGLAWGNFWIYPDKVAQGWDSTRAHIPYYSLLREIRMELGERDINPSVVGTNFPMKTDFKYLSLRAGEVSFKALDWEFDQYVLWSNIHNDFSNDEIDMLQNDWQELIHLERSGIRMILYEHP